MAYATSTTRLLEIAGNDAALVTEALEAGAGAIDDAFRAAGYETPLDTTELVGDAKTRLDAQLAVANRSLAAGTLSAGETSTGRRGQSERVAKNRDLALEWLGKVERLQLTYPLTRAFPVAVLGDARPGLTPDVLDYLYHPSVTEEP